MTARNPRSTRAVFEDHLHKAKQGFVEDDLAQNYATDVVILSRRGIHRGHDGVRQLAKLLQEELPGGAFTYATSLTEGEFAYLEWTGHAESSEVNDGADSFVIRNGRIVAQTIHYTVTGR